MSKSDSQQSGAKNAFASFRTGLFGALFVLSKHHETSAASAYAELAVKLAQLLSFVLAKESGFEWVASSMSGLKLVLGLVTVNGYAQWFDSTSFLVLFYLSLAWVSAFVSLFAWATWSFANGSFAALWPLKLLRAVGGTSATLLYIPMLTMLLAGFRCNSESVLYSNQEDSSWWLESGFDCASPGWYIQIAITAVFLLAFVCLCSLWAACVQDRHPLSTNLSAKAHGRQDLLLLFSKTVLVAMIKGWPSAIPVAAHIAVLIIVAATWLGMSVYYQPYLHHSMNRANAAAAAVLLSSCIYLATGQSYYRIDAAIAWYICLPFAAFAGACLCDMRANHVANCAETELRSATDVALRLRFMLHEQLFGRPTSVLPISSRPIVALCSGVGATAGKAASAHEDGEEGASSVHPSEDIKDDLHALSQEDDLDSRAQIVRCIFLRAKKAVKAGRGLVDPLDQAQTLLTEGLARFRHSPMLHVLASGFNAIYAGNRHLQMNHLMQAERKSPGLDLQYVIFAIRRAVEESGSGGNGKQGPSALARVAFEKYTADAKSAVSQCLQSQSRFWTEMANPRPSLATLHQLADRITTSIHQATNAFTQLGKINAHSLTVMRLQAEFSLYALNDPDKAAMLVGEAERIEETQAKELKAAQGKRLKMLEVSNLDVMSETAGLVVVSAAPGNLGTILSASPSACRMFGYPKWQLERRSVDILVPQPISEWHSQALRRFIVTGNSRVVDTTRMVLGQHRSGFSMPMLLTVRESSASDGPPVLIGLIQPLSTGDDFFLLDFNYNICAASQRGMTMFGLTSAALAAREVTLHDLVPNLNSHLKALAEETGATLDVKTVLDVGSTANEAGAERPSRPSGRASTPGLDGSRRGSVAKGKPAVDTTTAAATAADDIASARVTSTSTTTNIKAWLTSHSSLTGNSFYSFVWNAHTPVKSGGHWSARGMLTGRSNSAEDQSEEKPAISAMSCPFLANNTSASSLASMDGNSDAYALAHARDSRAGSDMGQMAANPLNKYHSPASRAVAAIGRASSSHTAGSRHAVDSTTGHGRTSRDSQSANAEEDADLGPLHRIASKHSITERLTALRTSSPGRALQATSPKRSSQKAQPDTVDGRTTQNAQKGEGKAAVKEIRFSDGALAKAAPSYRNDDRDERSVDSSEFRDGGAGGMSEEEDDRAFGRRGAEKGAGGIDAQKQQTSRGGSVGTGGDRGSYASSRASVHNRRIMSKLRSVLDPAEARHSAQTLVPQLKMLRLVALLVSAMAAAVAIGLNLYAAENIVKIMASAQAAFLLGDLCQDVLVSTQELTSAVQAELGISNNFTHAFIDRKQEQGRLFTMRALELQGRLFDSLQTVNSDFSTLILAPSMYLTRAEVNGKTGDVVFSNVRVSVYGALDEFLVTSQRLSAMDVTAATTETSEYQFLNANGFPGQEFSITVDATLGKAVSYLTGEVDYLTDFMETVFTATLVVLAAACLLIMLPLVFSLETAKDTLLTSILVLPPIILNTLRAQADNHLTAFQSSDDDDVEEGDDGGSMVSGGDGSVDFNEEKSKGDEAGALLPTNEDGEFAWSTISQQAKAMNKLAQEEAAAQDEGTAGLLMPQVVAATARISTFGWLFPRAKPVAAAAADAPLVKMDAKTARAAKRAANVVWTAQPRTRAGRKSPWAALKNLLLFNSPLIFLFILLALSMTRTEQNLDAGVRSTHVAVASAKRASFVRGGYIGTRRAIRSAGSAEQVQSYLWEVMNDTEELATWSTLLLQKPILPVYEGWRPDDSASRAQGMLRSAATTPGVTADEAYMLDTASSGVGLCAVLLQHKGLSDLNIDPLTTISEEPKHLFHNSMKECMDFPAGTMALSVGIRRVEDDWIRAVRKLLQRRSEAVVVNATYGYYVLDNSPYIPTREFLSEDFDIMYRAVDGILGPAYSLQTMMLQRATSASFASFLSFQTALLVSCLVLYLVLVIVVYFYAVPRINTSILKQRSLLLLLPVPILDHPAAAELRNIVNNTLAESGIGINRVRVGGMSSQSSVRA